MGVARARELLSCAARYRFLDGRMISQDEFDAFAAQGFNRIPVAREVFSDLDTPLSVYLKLADGPYTYLLESVEGGENWGRHSIIGLPCKRVYKLRGRELTIEEFGDGRPSVANSTIRSAKSKRSAAPSACRACRTFPNSPVDWSATSASNRSRTSKASSPVDRPDRLGLPDVLLMLSEEVAVFDNLKGRLYLIVHADPAQPQAYARAQRRLDELAFRLRRAGPSYPEVLDPKSLEEADFKSTFTRDEYCALVEKAKEYIRAGDIFQVVPSQRLSVPFRARPVDVYRALRALNPSPYMYFLDLGCDADRRLVAGNPGAAEERQSRAAPDRRHAAARQDARRRHRPRTGTARRSERTRRAPDADRSRPQRCRPRQQDGLGRRSPKASSSSAIRT